MKFVFNNAQVIIYPTYFSKLYLDQNYGDRSTVFTDKIQTQLGINFCPGKIDTYEKNIEIFEYPIFCTKNVITGKYITQIP